MITLTRKQAQELLDLLEYFNQFSLPPHGIAIPAEIDDLMETLRARLSEPEPEPVAWMVIDNDYKEWEDRHQIYSVKQNGDWFQFPIYLPGTALPQREWQGLTDEEIRQEYFSYPVIGNWGFARAIEAKLRDKNA